MRYVLLTATLLFFFGCLLLPFVAFRNGMEQAAFRTWLLALSCGYFICAPMFAGLGKRGKE